MVFVADKKYACETCIKGHRSSSCKHTDRPLFEIKKKGRPVTQCEHCRELRKTRQIHVKCVCENKEASEEVPGPSGSKGGPKLPARAAFPSGLPEDLLEASVASQLFSEGSDSDQSSRGCSCKDGATCTCWTPRNRGKRAAKPHERRNSEARPISTSVDGVISQPAALVVHAHAGGNRPVLPKPAAERPSSPPRTSHSPSLTQSGRLPTHGQSFYSPYSRAYEYSHATGYPSMNEGNPFDVQGLLNTASNTASSFGAWPPGAEGSPLETSPLSSPPACGCGASCACPGCLEHNGPNADLTAACANPNNCVACVECNINILAALATGNARAMYDPSGMQNVDDWLRQVPSMPDITSPTMQSPIFSPDQSQPDLRYDPSMLQTYGMWNEMQNGPVQQTPTINEECCGGQCRCPPGMCRCDADRFDSASGRTLTFAVSGERAPCCGGGASSPARLPATGPGPAAGPSSRANLAPPNAPRFAEGTWLSPTLAVPRTPLSRASSSSSKSSPHPSTSSSSPASFGDLTEGSAAQRGAPSGSEVGSCCVSMGNLSTNVPTGSSSGAHSNRRGSDHNEYRTRGSGSVPGSSSASVEYHSAVQTQGRRY
ncbi:hypothetical protein BD310DRAFT_368489 [Dichomitus squalens]|uniref:Copper-fist domain-containing protein n=1 Tax=Dichomitus squalens TaxID=114155 RepID=A0A4Q9PYJ9_9APHY|nr:hypothetical protein BD310DRAFT_368489 [Dichomitus squalens]